MDVAAAKLQLTLDTFGVHNESDLGNALAAAARAKAQAIALTSKAGQQIAELALQNKMASVSFTDSFPKRGGLLSYGPNILVAYSHAAYFVARILHGARPAELPVEQPTKFSLGINVSTARALNIKVPDMLLVSADEMIE
jgi:putative ABC transport system substrate-binding protein